MAVADIGGCEAGQFALGDRLPDLYAVGDVQQSHQRQNQHREKPVCGPTHRCMRTSISQHNALTDRDEPGHQCCGSYNVRRRGIGGSPAARADRTAEINAYIRPRRLVSIVTSK